MTWKIPITALVVFIHLFFPSTSSNAETSRAYEYKILANEEIGLSIKTIETQFRM